MNGGQAGREALWFQTRPDGKISCLLCPHACVIPAGGRGICRVRLNQDGALRIPYYGRISSLAVDPIEKKPLYHFHPGSRILSAGFVGCSFRCRFCQNWQISQTTDIETRYLSPSDLVDAAKRERSFGIAYTYSEPLIHAEYLLDAAREARAAGLKNVLVSNGYLNPGPAEEVLSLMDAANIDLKAYDDGFYRTETGGTLEDVKRFLAQAARLIHLEVTTLIIPSKNDDPGQIEGIARFIASLGADIPLHLSAYHPDYRYEIPATPAATIKNLAEIAQRHLRYVYTGNLGAEQADTACKKCGAVLVHRVGYSVRVEGVRNGACIKCGDSVPIVGI
ncbi:MAG: AmmeMemoRadiSam system radical SAM enzyme [Spirochaetia bacterium]|jgi:pyruvate formate lyase activating enzyme